MGFVDYFNDFVFVVGLFVYYFKVKFLFYYGVICFDIFKCIVVIDFGLMFV